MNIDPGTLSRSPFVHGQAWRNVRAITLPNRVAALGMM
jgi:hypothetical protein